MTAGIVSARGRDIGAGPYDDFLQIDAAVNRGNSGGPAFNLSGEVVGINTAIFSPSGGNVGIAFAIPASTAREVVQDLIKDGAVQRGWLGVEIQPVTPEIAESLGLTAEKGALSPTHRKTALPRRPVSWPVTSSLPSTARTWLRPRSSPASSAVSLPASRSTSPCGVNGKSEVVKVDLGELPGAEQQAALRTTATRRPRPTSLPISA